jgi:hypothetical protein
MRRYKNRGNKGLPINKTAVKSYTFLSRDDTIITYKALLKNNREH